MWVYAIKEVAFSVGSTDELCATICDWVDFQNAGISVTKEFPRNFKAKIINGFIGKVIGKKWKNNYPIIIIGVNLCSIEV